MIKTRLTEMLGIRYPIIQAGMGPWSTEKLCVATANAGALGIISTVGIGYKWVAPSAYQEELASKSPYQILREVLESTRQKTAESRGIFGVNIPLAEEFREPLEELFRATRDARREDEDMAERLRVIITSAGNPTPWTQQVKEAGTLWFHVAPSVYHAQKAEKAGVDAVIASGREGGGHVAFEPVHTMVLLPQVVRSVGVPVIGAGGFCDGASLVAALALGAIGIQMGTRFIATQESDFTQMWKEKVLESDEKGTVPGISIFGPARYLKNQVSLRLAELLRKGFQEGYQEGVELETRGIILSMEGKDPDWSIFFGGEVAGRIENLPTVKELVESIGAEAEQLLGEMNQYLS